MSVPREPPTPPQIGRSYYVLVDLLGRPEYNWRRGAVFLCDDAHEEGRVEAVIPQNDARILAEAGSWREATPAEKAAQDALNATLPIRDQPAICILVPSPDPTIP